MPTDFEEAWLQGPTDTEFYTRTYVPAAATAVLVFVHGFIGPLNFFRTRAKSRHVK